jgi:hypothetical protein
MTSPLGIKRPHEPRPPPRLITEREFITPIDDLLLMRFHFIASLHWAVFID